MKSYSRIFLLLAFFCLAGCSHVNVNNVRTEGFIEVEDGVRLHYVQQGTGTEVLVAPVGFYLEPHLLDELSDSMRVVFYDPRNRGRSDAGDLSSVSLNQQVADLESLRTALGIDRMTLLGWSGLGMEMAVYTLRHPDRVTRLIQMSPVPPAASIMQELGDSRGAGVNQTALEDLDQRNEEGEFKECPDEFCRLYNNLTLPGNFADPSFIQSVPDVCLFKNEWPIYLWRYFGSLLRSFDNYDWREELKDLDIPRLVIHGKEDGIPLIGAQAWVAGYPTARIMVLSPAGHFPYIEQKDRVVSAIKTFVTGKWPDSAEQLP